MILSWLLKTSAFLCGMVGWSIFNVLHFGGSVGINPLIYILLNGFVIGFFILYLYKKEYKAVEEEVYAQEVTEGIAQITKDVEILNSVISHHIMESAKLKVA